MLTHKTTGTGVVKILMPFPFMIKIEVYGVRLAQTIRIIGLIFYEGTLDAQRNINEILNPFFFNLAPAEKRSGYFTQDGAT
jgi:hypothetical protein